MLPALRHAALILCLALCACAATPPAQDVARTTAPPALVDPPDSALDPAVQAFLVKTHGPKFSHYDYIRADLDGDGRRDALVLFSNPYIYWCNMNGCSLSVFKATNAGFVPMSQIFPVRGPLYISRNENDGWHDLIIRVTGREYANAKTVAMHFDGTRYPRNPFFEPGIPITPNDYTRQVFP